VGKFEKAHVDEKKTQNFAKKQDIKKTFP